MQGPQTPQAHPVRASASRRVLIALIVVTTLLLVSAVAFAVVRKQMQDALPPPTHVDPDSGLTITNLSARFGDSAVPIPEGYRMDTEIIQAEPLSTGAILHNPATDDRQQIYWVRNNPAVTTAEETCQSYSDDLLAELESPSEVTMEQVEVQKDGVEAARCSASGLQPEAGVEYDYMYLMIILEDGSAVIHQTRSPLGRIDDEEYATYRTFFECQISQELDLGLAECSS